MKTGLSSPVGLLLLLCTAASADVVDRVAITVGTKVITESEITQRIRLTAFQNGQVAEFSVAARREAAQRLIDLKLVEHEMDLGHYARIEPARTQALVDAFAAEHFRSSPEALRLALGTASLTPEDLREELAGQADLLSFLNLRFRPSVQVSDQEIEKYFHGNVEPKAGATPVNLADVRASIEQLLSNERADRDLEEWLRDQRKRTRITWLIEELR
jgi:hypothetical protein